MSQKLWFRRKLYGWGWYPITWEGWLAILAYVVIMIFIVVNFAPSKNGSPLLASDIIFKLVLPIVLLTALLIGLCYKKGEKPRFQWGKDRGDK